MRYPEDYRSFLMNHGWRTWASDEHETDAKKGLPLLPPEKPYPEGAEMIDLVPPQDFTVGTAPLLDVIHKRRSRRRYAPEPLSLEELSFLLWATQGVHKVREFPAGKLTRRTVPSGGSFHAFETYLVINRVDGIRPGLYRYLPIEHKLLFIKEDAELMDKVLAANCGNTFVNDCAVFFIWTCIPYRMEYQYSIVAHKVMALDAGHVCQNLYLAAESIGAGACAIDGYFQEEMDAVVDADGKDEFAIYAASVGRVDQQKG